MHALPNQRKRLPGFTIVELLIVIVVIGILATITLVTYNGIQAKAENTKTSTSVMSYSRVVQSYAALNGVYPIANWACLGPSGTRCGNMIDSTGACNGAGGAMYQAAFDTALKTIASSISPPSTQSMNCGGKNYGGAWFYSLNGNSGTIMYYLKGDQGCVTGSGVSLIRRSQIDDTTECYISFPSL
ncbi:MAG: type II secretion system protein [Candidatus Saccharibacteria bacterium]